MLRTLSAIALLLIILPLLPALLLAIPAVQNVVIDRAAEWAGAKLGTKVEVGRITVGPFNRIVVRDFYVADWDDDTLLYVKRADAYIGSLASMVKKNLVITYGNIQGGEFVVRETERGTFAVKEITDQLVRNRKENSGFRLDVLSLDASGVDFKLLRIDEPRDAGVDFSKMHLIGMDTHIDNLLVKSGGHVAGDISRLSFVERSGFALSDMSGAFLVDNGQIEVRGAHLQTELSDINLNYLLLDGENWEEYKESFVDYVPIICDITESRVSSEDVGYFAPAIWNWKTTVRNASLAMNGAVADFEGKITHVTLDDGGVLQGSARVKGLVDVEHTEFDIKVDKLNASTEEITYLLSTIAHLSLGESASHYVERIKGVNASGEFRGTIRDFKAKAKAHLASGGDVALECSMQNPAEGRKGVKATVKAAELDLATILAESIFGDVTFDANIDAELGDGEPMLLKGDGQVEQLTLNGCNYNNLVAIADIEDERIAASLSVGDEVLKLDAQAILDYSDRNTPLYDAVMSVEHADLHAMNINKRDSVAMLSANVGLSVRGASLDEMNGELRIADAEYETVGRGCEADLVVLSIESNEDARTLTLASDFADAVFESRTPYKNVIYYLKNLLAQYAPLLYDEEARQNINTHVAEIGNEVAVLSVTTKEIDPLLSCLTDGLEMAEGSKVEMLVSPSENRFLMHASSDYLMHHNYLVTDIDVKAGNASDSLALSLAAKDIYAGMFHFSDVGVNGGAKDNTINVDAMFADSLRDLRGKLSARANVSRKNNRRNLSILLNPSSVHSGDTAWHITTDGIDMDSSRVDIRRFAVRSNTQELFVDGVASRSDKDSVYMSLRNFSLAPFTQITNRLGYEIDGRTNGYATVHSALKDTRVDARIEMDSVNVSGIAVPDLLLTSQWDFGRSRASLDISTIRDNNRVIEGYFAPSQMRYYARMQTEGVDMNLLDPLLESVITDTEGTAKVDLTISGERRMAELRGEIVVDSLATTVDYTRCRYSVPKATIKVNNNHLLTEKVPIFDKNGKEGTMSLDVSLEHLSNVEYNVDLRVNNMEVLNTTEHDNPMFYGSVFATGTGLIYGDKAGVKMDFVARSDDNSKFYMPLTDNSDISAADFLTFAVKEQDTTSYVSRKKMLFESRQRRRTSGGDAMEITMSLDIRPNAEVQLVIDPTVGDIIKGTGEGMLNLRINPQADIFEMYGDYTIEKGSYLFTLQNVINKWFDIEPGSTIQWTGEPLDALLNIDAVYRLKASLQPLLEGALTENNRSSRAVPVECFIHLTDRLTQPTVTFDIVVPNADSEVQNLIASALATPESKSQQFLYLIIANSFISESSNSMSSSIGASATAATGFEMLSNQFSNWLSSDDYKIVLRYRPRTEQMSDEVDFGFSKGLVDNRLLIEVEGNYIVDKTQVVNATSNFTGEAYLTWLIDRAGTLRLKGFTHTIDRFDENQGLQETGIGIYFKEDFNNARDLRYRLKNRFKREKTDKKEKETKNKLNKKQTKL
ncbi:MAG: translocation/assembly module TamB domain-containing protein [Alistipes sp.]|nr:translocation/assembly module TamB domain-containing protein [Alistipes sp.]